MGNHSSSGQEPSAPGIAKAMNSGSMEQATTDYYPQASSLVTMLKAQAEAHPSKRASKNWATTCIVVDAYRGGKKSTWRHVWRINGVRVKRDLVIDELKELLSLGLASVHDLRMPSLKSAGKVR